MKNILWISAVILLVFVSCKTAKINSDNLQGIYSYGDDIEKGRVGTVTIYTENKDSAIFYVDVNRGAPSYNMGLLLGKVKLENGYGIYYKKNEYSDRGCKFSLKFKPHELAITTLEDQDECGFGNGVYIDGTYTRTSDVQPEFYTSGEGDKVYFKSIKPADLD
ncbi:hypothetical protein [Moheibacter sediminis]|uniref:Lipoprotein n=1 Tax=Moheibacter sediminis TaxID=1434700 RepID=A0A1W2BVL6_9FLAO|nr:hypothetical protein [Moheibacter sediminis]SMC77045.1 hypothetical protein SAMN06296427_107188 [Moheibacter sediminis]